MKWDLYIPMSFELTEGVQVTQVSEQPTTQGEAPFPYWIIALLFLGVAGVMAGKVVLDYANRKYGKGMGLI